MKKLFKDWIIGTEHDEPDVISGCEPRPGALRVLILAMALFWAIIIGCVTFLYFTLGE